MTLEKGKPEPQEAPELDSIIKEKETVGLFIKGKQERVPIRSRNRREFGDKSKIFKNASKAGGGYRRPSYDTSKPVEGGQHFMVDDEQLALIAKGGNLVLEMENSKIRIKEGDLVILDPDELEPVEVVVIKADGKKVTVGPKPQKKE